MRQVCATTSEREGASARLPDDVIKEPVSDAALDHGLQIPRRLGGLDRLRLGGVLKFELGLKKGVRGTVHP